MCVFRIKDLEFSYSGSDNLIKIPDLDINKKRVTILSGPNGSGKTTFFKLICGYLNPKRGKIHSFVPKDKISYLPQEPYLLKRSVKKNIEYGLKLRKVSNRDKIIDESLDMVGLSGQTFLKRKWYELSGGEKKRIALAARLALNPDVLLLDEPSESVDAQTRDHLSKAVRHGCEKKNISFLISSHDRSWSEKTGDDFFSMIKGRIFKEGFFNIIDKSYFKGSSFLTGSDFHDDKKMIISPGSVEIRKEPFDLKDEDQKKYVFRGIVVSSSLKPGGGILYNIDLSGKIIFAQGLQTLFHPGDNVFVKFNPDKFISI